MGRLIDITGNRYARLRVLAFDHMDGKKSCWKCLCDCGNVVVLRKDHFAYAYSRQKSCGCLHREKSSARMYELHKRRKSERESSFIKHTA